MSDSFEIPQTVARQAPLSMGFSREEHWSGWPCPPPGILPDPGIKPKSARSPALTGEFFTTTATWEAHMYICVYIYYTHVLSCIWLFEAPWTVAHRVALSIFQARILEWVAISYTYIHNIVMKIFVNKVLVRYSVSGTMKFFFNFCLKCSPRDLIAS